MTQQQGNISSQAGLASIRGGQGQDYSGSPVPGEPGSRSNPHVRERGSRDVPAVVTDGPKGQASAAAGIRSVLARKERLSNAGVDRRAYTPPTMDTPDRPVEGHERD